MRLANPNPFRHRPIATEKRDATAGYQLQVADAYETGEWPEDGSVFATKNTKYDGWCQMTNNEKTMGSKAGKNGSNKQRRERQKRDR